MINENLHFSVAKDHRITVRFDAKRFAQLSDYADKEGFTVSAIVRHVIHRFVEQQSKGSALPVIGRFRQ